jgi:acetyltransferase-like isoleucine patch superfamily enzyme
MLAELRNLLRGLGLLRSAEVVRFLGEERLRSLQLARLRSLAPELRLSDSLVVLGHRDGLLELGRGVQLREGTVLAFGSDSDGFGAIRIGPGTWVGQYNNLRASEGGDIIIGSNCLISQFCTLVGSQHAHALGPPIVSQGAQAGRRGVRIGDDVWLGAGVVVTPGVHVGAGAIIGANAVVTESIPENEIWAGVPARKIGERVA